MRSPKRPLRTPTPPLLPRDRRRPCLLPDRGDRHVLLLVLVSHRKRSLTKPGAVHCATGGQSPALRPSKRGFDAEATAAAAQGSHRVWGPRGLPLGAGLRCRRYPACSAFPSHAPVAADSYPGVMTRRDPCPSPLTL